MGGTEGEREGEREGGREGRREEGGGLLYVDRGAYEQHNFANCKILVDMVQLHLYAMCMYMALILNVYFPALMSSFSPSPSHSSSHSLLHVSCTIISFPPSHHAPLPSSYSLSPSLAIFKQPPKAAYENIVLDLKRVYEIYYHRKGGTDFSWERKMADLVQNILDYLRARKDMMELYLLVYILYTYA